MSDGCWIDWDEEPATSGLRRRVFGPSNLDPAMFGRSKSSELVSIRAGPEAIVTVLFANGEEVMLSPLRRLAQLNLSLVARITLNAA